MRLYSKRHAPAASQRTGDRPASTTLDKTRVSTKSSGSTEKSIWAQRSSNENRQDTPSSSDSSQSRPITPGVQNIIAAKPQALMLSSRGMKNSSIVPNFGNDYSDVYVHRGVLPQHWVQNAEEPLKGYPKLQRLHDLKKEQFKRYAPPAVGIRCSEPKVISCLDRMIQMEMQFDVLMVNGCTSKFSFEQLNSLPLENLSARPSLLYLWVSSTKIAEGRQLMEKWGFRRGEDIVYVLGSFNSPHAAAANSWNNDKTVFRSSTWHCLMGLKGTLRRSTNTELIHCNVDTDVIIENKGQCHNVVPDEIYTIIENFTSMSRKIHIVPHASPAHLPVRPRLGWVVVSPDVFSVGSLNSGDYQKRKLIPVSPEIDLLRPQTPPAMH